MYRFQSIEEVIAAAELGCHSVTLSPTTLKELSSIKYNPCKDRGIEHLKTEIVNQNATAAPERLQHLLNTDPLASKPFVPARTDIDYLSDGGAELEKALLGDPVGSSRLQDAITMFIGAEAASKSLIEEFMSQSAS